MKRIHNVLFQMDSLRKPNPPSSFGRQTDAHDTFVPLQLSTLPDQRNLEQSDSIRFMQDFGKRKVEIQKFTRPVITDPISCLLPEKDRVFTDHALHNFVILSSNGSYSETRSLRCIKGRPKYLTGNVPLLNPYLAKA